MRMRAALSLVGVKDREASRALKSFAVASIALLAATAAAANDPQQPRTVVSKIDWDAAAAAIAERGSGTTADAFARLNAITGTRFADIGKSAAPVLLPIDVRALAKDQADGKDDAKTSDKYFGGFVPTKFFLTGPAGYDATFTIPKTDPVVKTRFPKPIEIQVTGATYVYDLDDPNHEEVFKPPKELEEKFPGMRRILRENHVRYAFERFGTPYVVSIQCYDMRPSPKRLTCKEADPVAVKFLEALQLAGGTPSPIKELKLDLTRPEKKSDFTYYGPGNLIPNTGWKGQPGRVDYRVYSRMRFLMEEAPGYIKSQAFLHWGDCNQRGRVGRTGKKGAQYRCKLNDKPLIFDESAPENFSYPWRDNFCEYRDFLVGQCPGGYGHQAQDIRPGYCVLRNAESDRCVPYQHNVAAVHDGLIWRMPGNLGLFIVANNENEHVRFFYLHMNPNFLDDAGWFSGRSVKEGEIVGKVSDWGDHENGTSYHIHFGMQVFTRSGWAWVNPYMSLVLAYERLIGGRGTEIKAGDAEPAIPDKPPVILQSAEPPAIRIPMIDDQMRTPRQDAEPTAAKKPPQPRRRRHRDPDDE